MIDKFHCFPACPTFCFRGCRGATGATGATGTAGATGATGASGFFDTYGSFYNPDEQTTTAGVPFAITLTLTASNLTLVANTVTINDTGVYLIAYGINAISGVIATETYVVLNGVQVVGTERVAAVSITSNSSTIIQINAGDVISLLSADSFTILNIDQPSVYLNIVRIA